MIGQCKVQELSCRNCRNCGTIPVGQLRLNESYRLSRSVKNAFLPAVVELHRAWMILGCSLFSQHSEILWAFFFQVPMLQATGDVPLGELGQDSRFLQGRAGHVRRGSSRVGPQEGFLHGGCEPLGNAWHRFHTPSVASIWHWHSCATIVLHLCYFNHHPSTLCINSWMLRYVEAIPPRRIHISVSQWCSPLGNSIAICNAMRVRTFLLTQTHLKVFVGKRKLSLYKHVKFPHKLRSEGDFYTQQLVPVDFTLQGLVWGWNQASANTMGRQTCLGMLGQLRYSWVRPSFGQTLNLVQLMSSTEASNDSQQVMFDLWISRILSFIHATIPSWIIYHFHQMRIGCRGD